MKKQILEAVYNDVELADVALKFVTAEEIDEFKTKTNQALSKFRVKYDTEFWEKSYKKYLKEIRQKAVLIQSELIKRNAEMRRSGVQYSQRLGKSEVAKEYIAKLDRKISSPVLPVEVWLKTEDLVYIRKAGLTSFFNVFGDMIQNA